MNIDDMRCVVSQAYPGPGWKKKVATMPEDQLVAVYYRIVNGKSACKSRKKVMARKDGKSTITYEQVTKEITRTPYSFEEDGPRQMTLEDLMKGCC